jgi:hypothetical protein
VGDREGAGRVMGERRESERRGSVGDESGGEGRERVTSFDILSFDSFPE